MTILENKRFPVLDKGWVELQDCMGDDLAVVNAARTSVRGESKGRYADMKLLNSLSRDRHTVPFEHVVMTFRVKAPNVVIKHWIRHRTWSFSVSSARYSEYEQDDVYIPAEWRQQSKTNKQGSAGICPNSPSLTKMLEAHYEQAFALYEIALSDDVAREQARYLLPSDIMYHTMVCTVNLKNLLDFLELRMADDAQYEIRMYAKTIFEEIVAPMWPENARLFRKRMQEKADDKFNRKVVKQAREILPKIMDIISDENDAIHDMYNEELQAFYNLVGRLQEKERDGHT